MGLGDIIGVIGVQARPTKQRDDPQRTVAADQANSRGRSQSTLLVCEGCMVTIFNMFYCISSDFFYFPDMTAEYINATANTH